MEMVVAYSMQQHTRLDSLQKGSHGDMMISYHLTQLALKMMDEHPTVQLEEGLSVLQWDKAVKHLEFCRMGR